MDNSRNIATALIDSVEENRWADWEPIASDASWLEMHVKRISHNGVWATTQGSFAVDHHNKRLVYRGHVGQIFYKTRRVAEKIGWSVVREDELGSGEMLVAGGPVVGKTGAAL